MAGAGTAGVVRLVTVLASPALLAVTPRTHQEVISRSSGVTQR